MAVSGSSPSDIDTETEAGWLSPGQLEQMRAHVPLVYVDAVPVRGFGDLDGVTSVFGVGDGQVDPALQRVRQQVTAGRGRRGCVGIDDQHGPHEP